MSEERTDPASLCLPLLLQTPPGQLKNVWHDIQGIVSASPDGKSLSSDTLLAQAQPYLEQHSHEQLSVAKIEIEGKSDYAIVCDSAKIVTDRGMRYLHPRMQCSFRYDHAQEAASDVKPYVCSYEFKEVCKAVDECIRKYVYDHFHTGVSSVFPSMSQMAAEDVLAQDTKVEPADNWGAHAEPSRKNSQENFSTCDAKNSPKATNASVLDPEAPHMAEIGGQENPETKEAPDGGSKVSNKTKGKETDDPDTDETSKSPSYLTIHIVGNKYNLRNFWSARWRSTYVVDLSSHAFVKASIRVNAHYFENGNVQLNAENCELPEFEAQSNEPDSIAKALASTIEKHEQGYQQSLFHTTDSLRERSFKALRRTLPITRQKIDWDKAVSYKLGAELAQQ